MIALGRKEGRKAKVRIIGRNSEGLCLIYNERRNVKGGKTKEPGLKISKGGRSGDSRNGGKRKKGKKENSK